MWGIVAAVQHRPIGPALMWLGGAIVLVVIGGLLVLRLRGAVLDKGGKSGVEEGLLAGLRRMRDSGEMSVEEYDAAKRSMAARAAGSRPSAPPVQVRPAVDLTGDPLPPQKPEGDG